MFYKKSVLEHFAKITRKHLFQSFFNVAGLRSETLFKRETPAQVFSCEFCEIFKKIAFTEHLLTAASGFPLTYNLNEFITRVKGVCYRQVPSYQLACILFIFAYYGVNPNFLKTPS